MGTWVSKSRDWVIRPLAFPAPHPPGYRRDSPNLFYVNNTPCFFIRHPLATKTILYSHGNGADIGYCLERMTYLAGELKVNVLLYDYPGYGPHDPASSNSTEVTTEKGCYRAAENAYSYLLQQGIRPSDIILYGSSVGTGPTTWLARKLCTTRNSSGSGVSNIQGVFNKGVPNAVILQAPFKSALSVVSEGCANSIRYSSYVSGREMDIFDNYTNVEFISCPLFIMHGTDDKIVPFSQGVQLYNRAKECGNRAYFRAFPGGTHNNLKTDHQSHWLQILRLVTTRNFPT